MPTISKFIKIENRHGVCKGKDCLKKFCESLGEHTINIVNFKIKKNEVINKGTTEVIWKCKNLL